MPVRMDSRYLLRHVPPEVDTVSGLCTLCLRHAVISMQWLRVVHMGLNYCRVWSHSNMLYMMPSPAASPWA